MATSLLQDVCSQAAQASHFYADKFNSGLPAKERVWKETHPARMPDHTHIPCYDPTGSSAAIKALAHSTSLPDDDLVSLTDRLTPEGCLLHEHLVGTVDRQFLVLMRCVAIARGHRDQWNTFEADTSKTDALATKKRDYILEQRAKRSQEKKQDASKSVNKRARETELDAQTAHAQVSHVKAKTNSEGISSKAKTAKVHAAQHVCRITYVSRILRSMSVCLLRD